MHIIEYRCKNCKAERTAIIFTDPDDFAPLCPDCRVIRGGQKNKGPAYGMWSGGRIKHSGGYVYIHVKALSTDEQELFRDMADSKGYILEHRLVAARELGRPLTDKEIAHHKNSDKADNRPDNIGVFADMGKHTKYHAALRAVCG